MENCIKLRINAGDKNASNTQDKAIADAYGNKFIIALDFEMLDSAVPYYQAGLRNRLCYKLTFNDYNQVTKSGVSSPKVPDASIRSHFILFYLFQILKTYIHAALHARWVLRCLKTAKYLQINKTDKKPNT